EDARKRSRAAGFRIPRPAQMAPPLDFALIKRLREVLDDRPATEAELRALSEQADAWARTVSGQLEASERRIHRPRQKPRSPPPPLAREAPRPRVRAVKGLRPPRAAGTRRAGTGWLLSQTRGRRRAGHQR